MPIITAAKMEEDTRMKNRYGCLRENIDFFFKYKWYVILTAMPGAGTTKHENTGARSQEPE
ncbi:MAG: hypothetical protein KKF00_03490 [Proteobacteria bacterium]|nr:hypothetical protein [Pseudomonadota bacterium]